MKNPISKKAIAGYRLQAEQGLAEGQINLGRCYRDGGEELEKDFKETFKWFKLAAEQKSAEGQFMVGYCYEYGAGVEKDFKEAFKWFKLAAEQEYARAQTNLGLCYLQGQGVGKDEKQGFEWLKRAANQRLAEGQFNLALCYKNGTGVARDDKEFFRWSKLAADQGYPSAQVHLGHCYSNEIGVELDLKEAHKYYRLAANQGNAEAQCSLGAFYYKGTGVTKNLEEAIKLLTQAGRAGVVEAQENLGLHYFKVGERLNAIAWLDLAANQGNVSSQFALGCCFMELGPAFEEKTVEWFTQAANQGHDDARYNLGIFYQRIKKLKEAFQCFKLVAERGLVNAQFNLGWCYKLGEGVTENREEALKWFTMAANQGDIEAQAEVQRLTRENATNKNLNKEQIKEDKYVKNETPQEKLNGALKLVKDAKSQSTYQDAFKTFESLMQDLQNSSPKNQAIALVGFAGALSDASKQKENSNEINKILLKKALDCFTKAQGMDNSTPNRINNGITYCNTTLNLLNLPDDQKKNKTESPISDGLNNLGLYNRSKKDIHPTKNEVSVTPQ